MKVLILSRRKREDSYTTQRILASRGHEVDCSRSLELSSRNLSDYDLVVAHPVQADFQALYDEANMRPEFKLIFFNTPTLTEVDPSKEFKNNNVYFVDYFNPCHLERLLGAKDKDMPNSAFMDI